jgi:hypothetical protein
MFENKMFNEKFTLVLCTKKLALDRNTSVKDKRRRADVCLENHFRKL